MNEQMNKYMCGKTSPGESCAGCWGCTPVVECSYSMCKHLVPNTAKKSAPQLGITTDILQISFFLKHGLTM
jgi:hypothetical protein